MRLPSLLRPTAAQLALLAFATLAAYAGTFAVPFTFDDYSSIRDNDLIWRWRGIEPLWRFEPNRLFTYLTFRWNYLAGGFDVTGYHVVNLLVHLGAGVALYGFLRGLLRTPRVAASLPDQDDRTAVPAALPLLAALIFLLHPLQTQAVTYIVQRLASLAALCYLVSLAAWVQARLAGAFATRAAWFALSAVAMGLGFFSKESAATLPLAILLVETLAFAPGPRRLLATAAGAGLALALFAISAVVGRGGDVATLDALSRETPDLTRIGYLATQSLVVLRYLWLFFVPTGLRLDYDFAFRDGFGQLDVLAATAVHLALIVLAVACARRRPALAFAVGFVYLAHATESSLIPIRDAIFEHRTYLPNAGLALACGWLVTVEAGRLLPRSRWLPAVVAIALVALGWGTWRRNQVWRDPVALWQSNAELEPEKPRPRAMLGRVLLEADHPAEAVAELTRAMELRRGARADSDAPIDAINLVWGLRLLGRHDEALAWVERAEPLVQDDATRAQLRVNEGNVHFDRHDWSEAERAFRAALELAPASLAALGNLASTRAQQGDLAEAESLWVEVLRVDPADRPTRINLAQARAGLALRRAEDARRAGRSTDALAAAREALAGLESAHALDAGDAALGAALEDVRRRVRELETAR